MKLAFILLLTYSNYFIDSKYIIKIKNNFRLFEKSKLNFKKLLEFRVRLISFPDIYNTFLLILKSTK